MTLNEQEIKFAPHTAYFVNKPPAVYGIYHQNELIYIGSTSDYTTRWAEHCLSFERKHANYYTNQMYQQNYDISELRFEILYNEEQVKTLSKTDELNMYVFEMVEKCCIEKYKPRFNIEGNTQPFRFNASQGLLKHVDQIQSTIEDSLKE